MRLLLFFFFITFTCTSLHALYEDTASQNCLQQARAGYISSEECITSSDPRVTYCSTQPTLTNSSQTISDYGYPAGNCTIRTLPITCVPGYTLSDPYTPNAKCVASLLYCLEQPETSYALTIKRDYFYSVDRCTIRILPTSCQSGYKLKNPNTPEAYCMKNLPLCSSQPSTLHVTSKTADYIYDAGNCIIAALPTACEDGYTLLNPNTPEAACSLELCTTQPDPANSSSRNTGPYTGLGAPCLLHEITGCNPGYALTPEPPHLKHCVSMDCDTGYTFNANTGSCQPVGPCSTQPSTANATSSLSNFFYAAGNCKITNLPTACQTGFELQNANTPQAACTSIGQCANVPTRSTPGVKSVRENQLVNGCLTNIITECNYGYVLDKEKNTCTCPAGRHVATGSTTCSLCLSGTYSKEGATKCSTCPTGTYSSSGSSSCSKCLAGKYLPEGKNVCYTCEYGTYTNQEGAYRRCNTCPSGHYSNKDRTACIACGAGYRVNSSKSGCEQKLCHPMLLRGQGGVEKTTTTRKLFGDCFDYEIVSCQAGYKIAADKHSCTKITCSASQYLDGSTCKSCAEGYKINAAKTGCDKIVCTTQPSTANSSKTSSDVYYAGGKCWLTKVPTTCKTGYTLQHPNTDKATCVKAAACNPQPSIANAKATADNDFFSNGCWVTGKYATACNEGFTLKDAKSSKARCEKSASCSTQPDTKNAIETAADIYNKSAKCWIKETPVKCDYSFLLKDKDKVTARCEKAPTCKNRPSAANAAKKEAFFIEKDNCFVFDMPTACEKGYSLKYGKSDKARCEKVNECRGRISTRNVKTFQDDFFYEKKKCFITKLPIVCEDDYELKHARTDRAMCSKRPKKKKNK